MAKSIGIIRTFVQHPNAANLLMMVMILIGLFSAFQLNRQVFPTFGLDAVSINILWPGASAEDVDRNILEVIEPEIRFVDGVKEINGFAMESGGGFFIRFNEGTNMARAFSDLENGVRRVEGQLPQDIERPVINQVELMEPVSRVALSGPFSEAALKSIAKEMRDELLAAGVDKVGFIGDRDPEIRIDVDPSILRQFDLQLSDIAERVRDSSIDVPAGSVEGGFSRQIRSLGLARTVDAVGDIEIKARGTGEKTYLRDIANIQDGFDENQPGGFFAGRQAITLQIMRSTDTDSIDAARIVDEYLAKKKATLPDTLSVFHYQKQSVFVEDRVNLMVRNGLGGLAIVLVILYIFLNGRLAFWVAAGIPVAMLATFGFMLAADQSFNMVSLMALIMTLGIIVDDAIVVGEHAATRKEMGLPAVEAAESGAMRMFPPVLASSLTTIVAFLPVLMITDQMGQFMAVLPTVVVAVILASLVECFLILPGHMRSAMTHTKVKTAGFRVSFNRRFNEFRDTTFRNFVDKCYQARYMTVAVAISGLIVGQGMIAGGHVPFVHFPTAESEYLIANIKMAPGTPREKTLETLQELDRALREAERELTGGEGALVRATFGTIGRSMEGNSWQELNADNLAGLWVELAEADLRDIRNPEVLEAWRGKIKEIAGLERLTIAEQAGGPGGGRPIDIRLSGGDISTLKAAALDVRALLARFPGLIEIDDNLPYGKEEMIIELTPKGQAMGFTTASVSSQVRSASEGLIAKRFPRDGEENKVRIQYPEGTFSAQALRELYIRSPQGIQVPLLEVVRIDPGQGFARFQRYNGKVEVAVQSDIVRSQANLTLLLSTLPAEGLDAIAEKHNIEYRFGGEAEDQGRSLQELGQGAMLALAMIYIVLAWVLGSYSRPILVMAIIPFGLVGAVLGHLVLGYSLSMMSLVGLLGLMGILVNDSIILVTTIQERNKLGEAWESAVVTGSQDRLRAVVLTSLTTIGGLTPLMFETSMQAQFLKPMAITMVFGIGVATFIVLIVLPALLGILEDGRVNIPLAFRWLRDRAILLWKLVSDQLSSPKGGA
jgi:multidrug efflux pump subunit AcrB